MIDNISWSSYWLFILATSLVYYFFVIILYFRGDLLRKPFRKKSFQTSGSFSFVTPDITSSPSPSIDDTVKLESLIDEIKAYLTHAGQAKAEHPEIFASLKSICAKSYSSSMEPYKEAINNIIAMECSDKCVVRLSEDELQQVWN